MLLSSATFLFYCLPAVIVLYYLFSFSKPLQNVLLFAASIAIYALGQTVYVAVLLAVIVLNWAFGFAIKAGRAKGTKGALILAVATNAAVLFFFKQGMFVIGQLAAGPVAAYAPNIRFILPLGLSFYILQAIAYCFDIYRGEIEAEKNILNLGLYLAFFPKMMLGPIVSYKNFKAQLTGRTCSVQKFINGLSRTVIGLAKVVIVALPFAQLSRHVVIWSAMGRLNLELPIFTAWIGLASTAIYFLFQFSGICDMAIGISAMLGFELPENYVTPHLATTVTSFWARFNITVGNWFKQYVLHPRNRHSENKDAQLLNSFVMWMLLGLWYCVGWNFVIFAAIFFLIMLAEEFFDIKEDSANKISRYIYTQLAALIGCVFIITSDVYQAGRFLLNLVGANLNGFANVTTFALLKENWFWFLLAFIILIPATNKLLNKIKTHKYAAVRYAYSAASSIGTMAVFIISIIILLQHVPGATYYF